VRRIDVVARRVVAQHHHLGPLQRHDAEGLGPPPVVADALADDHLVLEHLPDIEAQVADLEILLLEMLVRHRRPVIVMAGQVDLAVLADQSPVRPDQDRRIEMMRRALFFCPLGVAKVEANTLLTRQLEQRQRLRARHLALEILLDLVRIFHPVAREEGRQRELREHDELGAAAVGFLQHLDHALDHTRPAIGEVDRPQLGGGHFQTTGHDKASFLVILSEAKDLALRTDSI
jgi:hypothetical protein